MSSFFCWDEVLWIFCLGWPQTAILPISASQVARISAVSHWNPAYLFFFRYWGWTQGLVLASKCFYHLSYTPGPFAFLMYFWDRDSSFLPRLAFDGDHSVSTSWVAGIMGLHHQAWLDNTPFLHPHSITSDSRGHLTIVPLVFKSLYPGHLLGGPKWRQGLRAENLLTLLAHLPPTPLQSS
jgi:hypothetical protein